jgi:hypothetical protein
MSRGIPAELGAERVAQNGYYYVKTETGWRLKHHVIAEEKFGRPVDTKTELVCFKDRRRTNFDPDNIIIVPKKGITKEIRLAQLQETIEAARAEISLLMEEESA